MLVPLRALTPPPARAEAMSTPGALTTGKVLEKGATSHPSGPAASAPTESTPSAAAGSATAISKLGSTSRRLALPAAATTTAPPSKGARAWTIAISASNILRLPR
jgi:hypothetical protein